MANTYLPMYASIKDILRNDNNALEILVNNAITDMVSDSLSQFKNRSDARKVTIELSIVRVDDKIHVTHKVTPKPAPYTVTPKYDAPTGQISIDEMIGDGEISKHREED